MGLIYALRRAPARLLYRFCSPQVPASPGISPFAGVPVSYGRSTVWSPDTSYTVNSVGAAIHPAHFAK